MKLQIDIMQETIEEHEKSITKLNSQIHVVNNVYVQSLQSEIKTLKEKLNKSNYENERLKKLASEKEEKQIALSIQKSLNSLKQQAVNTSRTVYHTKVIL